MNYSRTMSVAFCIALSSACGSAGTDGAPSSTPGPGGAGGGAPTLRECTHEELTYLGGGPFGLVVQPQGVKTFTGAGVVKPNPSNPTQGIIITLEDQSAIELSGVNFPKFQDGAELQVQFASFAPGPRDGDIVLALWDQAGKLLFFSYRYYFDEELLASFNVPFTLSFEPSCDFTRGSAYTSSIVLWTIFEYEGTRVRLANRRPGTLMLNGGSQKVMVDWARDLVGNPVGFDFPRPGRLLSYQIFDESLL
jgi:hypothetical protein